jgi:hypothetical protein
VGGGSVALGQGAVQLSRPIDGGAGGVGVGYGAGGGGAHGRSNEQPGYAGGVGTAGIIIVEEFY